MTGVYSRYRMALHTLLPLTLGALGCVTDPDAIASVVVSPERVTFASIHAPAETVTVTVSGTNGRTDAVTWQYFVYYTGWLPGVSTDLRVERVGSTNRFAFTPVGVPAVVFLRATAGGAASNDLWVIVNPGPPVALRFEMPPPSAPMSAVPFTVAVLTVDADGFATIGATGITASIASGTGTLSGTTSLSQTAVVSVFSNLIITGSGPHTLRFSSPGLADLVSEPFTVRAPPPE